CRPGKGGCSIYDQRPQVCRDYACGWLSGHLSHDYWFPPKAKMIVDTHRDKGTGVYTVRILVDPRHPHRWRHQPYYSDSKQIAVTALRNGFAQGRVTQTVIVIGDKWTKIVMPHRQVDYGPGIVLPPLEDGPGLDRFEFVPCKDSEAVKELDTKM